MTLWNKTQKAASWLDEKKPNWHKKIDILSLDLGDTCNCVHGQIFGKDKSINLIPLRIRSVFLYASIGNKPKSRKDENLTKILDEYWTQLIMQRRE